MSGILSSISDKISGKTPEPSTSNEAYWTQWSPEGPGDVRSPCPALNALANHNILPHNGKGITKAMAVKALTESYHLDSTIATVLSVGAIGANPDHSAHTFDLDHLSKHNYIEHDVSLSRDDYAFGSDSKFSPECYSDFLHAQLDGKPEADIDSASTSWKTAMNAKWARISHSQAKHEKAGKPMEYGLKAAILSYGESALYLLLLGKDGVAPLRWVDVFFREERLPYHEGWRPPTKINQPAINHAYVEMLKAHPHGEEEAKIVGLGTLEILRSTIMSLGITMMKTPTPQEKP